ncbi:MAG: DNA primase [Methylovirgula sp.]
MRFAPSFLEELKARLPVSEVVRRRMKLTKAGREWRGLSPFTSEKTPSFFVNDQKMAWFDFSSGRNGNIFDFLMATEGLSFPEAVERLAADAGLPLPKVSAEAEEQEKQRAGLQEVLEFAARFFEDALRREGGAKGRAYLASRGLSLETQKRFRLGYAPGDKFALRDALAAKGASSEVMVEAGLLIGGEDIAVPYDRFRDRVMFPICDRSGRVVAFGGRALEKDVQAKYLNSPETPLFHKGGLLYNHHHARQAAHEKGTVIAVEGYVDVIAMTVAGFPHTVAPLGTALTEAQCQLLWKMAEEPVLCFDGDRAGRKAAYRAVDIALPLIGPGRSLRFALLPEGQDPDDLARSGGAAAIEEVLGQALPLVDLIWLRETEGEALATPERRAGLERRLAELCGAIQDETLRRYYAADFRDRLARLFGQAFAQAPGQARQRSSGGSFFSPQREGSGFPRRGAGSSAAPPSYLAAPPRIGLGLAQSRLLRPNASSTSGREAIIILILLNHPGLLESYGEALAELDLTSSDAIALREKLLDLWGHGALPDHAALNAELERSGLGVHRRRLEGQKAHANLWIISPEAADPDAEEALKQALALHRKMRALNRELKSAEAALAQDGSETNLARLIDIQEQLTALAGMEAAVEGFGAASGRASGSL